MTRTLITLFVFAGLLSAQSSVNGNRTGGAGSVQNNAAAAQTLPNRTGNGVPTGTAGLRGETYHQNDATAGQNLWVCTVGGSAGTAVWAQVGSAGGGVTTHTFPFLATLCMNDQAGSYTSKAMVTMPSTSNAASVNSCVTAGLDNYINFPAGSSSYFWFKFMLPPNWDGGNITATVEFFFFGTAAGTATIKAATYCPASGSLAQTIGTPTTNAVTSISAPQGSIAAVEVTTVSSGSLAKTGAGNTCAAGKAVYVRVSRDSDSNTGGLGILGGFGTATTTN